MRIQHSEGAAECHYNVSVVLDGKNHSSISSEEETIFPATPNLPKFSTPPAILRKKKRLRVGQPPVNELSDGLCGDAINLALKHTPVKTLPFSPSQVSLALTRANHELQRARHKPPLVTRCSLNKYVQKLLRSTCKGRYSKREVLNT